MFHLNLSFFYEAWTTFCIVIGMMLETMAGKSSACHGLPFDATPFKFSENDSAVDYFGKTLLAVP